MYDDAVGLHFLRSQRVCLQKDYQSVFDHYDDKTIGPYFVVLCKKNALGHARLGVIVSKKSARLAVRRHAIKRLCRETFRIRQHKLKPLDFVLVARKRLASLSKSELNQCLERLWNSLHIENTRIDRRVAG